MIAPVPFKNTQLGWGLMLMGGVIHHFDSDTTIKPSTGMVGGFYTENGSWGVMMLEAARLDGDRWRLRFMLAHPEVRYNFYGIGEEAGHTGKSVELQQTMNFGTIMALRRVWPNVYFGPGAFFMGASVSVRDTNGLSEHPEAANIPDATLFALGLQAEGDTRDDDYWPTRGGLARVKAWFFLDALGATNQFERYILFWSHYLPMAGERLVLATNINMAAASDGTPFWALPAVGTGKGGLRGYTQGRYRDKVMSTEQVELRFHGTGRFGATAFLGFGHVAPTFGKLFDAQALFAGGVGLRYQLTDKYPMHIRVDYTWGSDGQLFYFGVSEAF